MIIYGGGSKDLGTRKLQGAKCTNCEATEIHLHVVVQYGTLFFIPLFPANKKYSSICGNCDQVLTKKQMPQQMKDKLALEKHHFKSPIYLYAGLGIIILLLGWFIYALIKDKQEFEENVQNLQPNSIVVFKDSSTEYSFARVASHSNDTVYIYNGNYIIDQRPSRSDLKKERAKRTDFFNTELFYLTQKEIDSLHTKGGIIEIYKYD